MKGIFLILVCSVLSVKSFSLARDEDVTCDRTYDRLGCYEEQEPGEPLMNERSNIDWMKIEEFMQSLACQCASKAKAEGYAGFALHYYGECYGRTSQQLDALTSKTSNAKLCVGDQTYTKCTSEHSHCTGTDWAEAIYTFKSSAEENVDGGLSEWQAWTSCDKNCGSGLIHRERNCNNPEPKGQGKDCSDLGSLSESKVCKLKECPVNGGWGSWGSYGSCSKNCGTGSQTRSRSCTNPSPANGGTNCPGSASSSQSCNTNTCPINGGWGSWGSYGSCSKNCGTGSQTRSRSCTNPSPAYEGADCPGSASSSQSCNTDTCPSLGSCTTKYTIWATHSSGNMVYLDRHRMNCGSKSNVLKMFHLERSGNNMRYKYTCCTLQGSVCSLTHEYTSYDTDGDGKAVYLDRHTADCSSTGFINDIKLERDSGHDNVRYNYYCSKLNVAKWQAKASCYSSYTSYTDDSDGKVYYLDRQTVSCNTGYALSYYRLQRNSGHSKWRYNYRCCKVDY